MKNKYKLLADTWQHQADESSDEQEQAWLYACSADLKTLISQQDNQAQDHVVERTSQDS